MDRIQDGYEVVAKEVSDYWQKEGITDVVIVMSLDGCPYTTIAFCESDSNYEEVSFLHDFWEGEQNISLFDITPLWEVLDDHEEDILQLYKDRKRNLK